MKKSFLAALCCLSLSVGSLMAQDNARAQFGRQGGSRNGRSVEQIADTAITNHLGLQAEQLTQVEALNARYKEQLQAQQKGLTTDGRRSASREDREARVQQFREMRQQFRSELHVILGDSLYIQYLEQSLDRQPMMMAPRGGMNGFNQGRGARMGGGRMGGGRMDAGGFDNGDF